MLAHTMRARGHVLKKGRVLDAQDVARLEEGGVEEVVVACLEPGDRDEDAAADLFAQALVGLEPERAHLHLGKAKTGRANLYAASRGVFCVDPDRVEAFNRVDEAVTLATIEQHAFVEAGDFVATLKIIPFAVSDAVMQAGLAVCSGHEPLVSIAPLRPHRSVLVLTRFDETPQSFLDRAAASQRARLAFLGATIVREVVCEHRTDALTAVLQDELVDPPESILILGVSAIQDRRDVVPLAIERAGGHVEHFGMPIDPGNLLLLGRYAATTFIGVPGCARSLTPSGFDFVLRRMVCGLPTTRDDIVVRGVGGLLRARRTEPSLRDAKQTRPRVGAVVLAAGRSTRMGADNKLLCDVEGKKMIAHVVDGLLVTRVRPIVVVTGFEAKEVELALTDRDVRFVHNPHYAEGMSTSIQQGIAALENDHLDGAFVALGDMPWIAPADYEAILQAFDPSEGASVCIPVRGRKRGNPVLWAARFFAEMRTLTGDIGARTLLEHHADNVREVPLETDAIHRDIDRPEELHRAR